MKTPSVSFGSLMVFNLRNKKAQVPMPQLMQVAFKNNKQLQQYQLQDVVHYKDTMNGTIPKAIPKFALRLDSLYSDKLPKGSNKVILTEANFYLGPNKIEKRYFLTAATKRDENKIHKTLSNSNAFYSAQFNN